MQRLWLEPADLTRIRFADRLHPVGTALLACQALRDPALAAAVPAMARRVLPAAALLHHLVPPRGLLPDFLTPLEGVESVEGGLAAIRRASPRRIRTEVAAAYAAVPGSALRRRFAAADPETLDAVVAALGRYFQDVLAPDWSTMHEAHGHRVRAAAQAYALSGVDGLLAGLHPAVRWRPPVLEVDTWRPAADVRLGGHGVILVPNPFAGRLPRVLVEPDRPALVVYPVAPSPGPARPAAGDPLARLLGRTRAALLRSAAGPGRHTTSSLARDVDTSLSSSSEHLSALRAARLLTTHREGGAMVHHPTPLALNLLSGEGV